MQKYIYRQVCCLERVKELMKSIPNLWYEIVDLKEYQAWLLIFGNNGGVVIYSYEFTIYSEIERMLNELEIS
jgi:hypothetical protein